MIDTQQQLPEIRPNAKCDALSEPETVKYITSRPPSVSSERELHYASLDLPPCSSSNAVTVANNIGNLPTGAASIQNPIAGAEAPSFTYAQIDFVKSTEHNNPSNNKNAWTQLTFGTEGEQSEHC